VPRRLGAYRSGPPLGYRNEMVVALAEWQVDSDRWVDFAAGECVEPQLTTCMRQCDRQAAELRHALTCAHHTPSATRHTCTHKSPRTGSPTYGLPRSADALVMPPQHP
jgi:hypothetical protein